MPAPIFVVSDLHLHDDEQAFMFTPTKEAIFVRLGEEILAGTGTLLLAGDIFDLTGTEAPRFGHREFFQEILIPEQLNSPRVVEAMLIREAPEQFAAIRIRFPSFFAILAKLAQQRRLRIIPGNHDCLLNQPQGRAAFAEALGVALLDLPFQEFYLEDNQLLVGHGHEFDAANATTHGCENPGKAITSVLFNAVMPALLEMGLPANVVAAIPAVRPEEAIVRDLEHYLGPERTKTFLLAFVRLLERNGYFSGPSRLWMGLLLHQVPVLSALMRRHITPARVRSALPDDRFLIAGARAGAEQLRKKFKTRFVVLGHTHFLDLQPGYVNLGTWIDHMTGLCPADLTRAECSLPVFRLENGHASLIDVRRLLELGALGACPSLGDGFN